MSDGFSQAYVEYLEGTYDSPDRIVLNAYFRQGHIPGGFRNWWRQMYGNDDDLDNAHLIRLAGRFSRRLRAYAKKEGIPVIDCPSGERKAELAQKYLPEEPTFGGLFLVLVGRASAPAWHVHRGPDGRIQTIVRKYPSVSHYYFHLMDPAWGHVTIRMSSHPPFPAQVILNGHEYLARQARQAGLSFQKEGNCFTQVGSGTDLAQLAETLCSVNTVGPLRQVCERWLYSTCLCFALPLEEQERTEFRYDYSLFQVEYSRNLLFQRGLQMEQLVEALIDRTRTRLDVKRLKTILGAKRRPFRQQGHPQPRLEVVTERPRYNLTVFKIHFGKLTLKLYTKGANVLRVEVIVHNTKALALSRALTNFPTLVAHLKAILYRFLDHLQSIDACFIADDTLDTLAEPSYVGQTRMAGLDLNKSRIRAVLEALVALALSPTGFTASDLAAKVRDILNLSPEAYQPRHAAYDLKKFRGKQWLRKIGQSRRYEATPDGLRTMAALLILREKVIKPVLAGAGKPKRGPKPQHPTLLDTLYHAIQVAMRDLFQALGVAV
ncbi:MAG: hypothetical protein DPW09_44930 [Anaerolineae bacterium]|nr:hypothetical protein [Anaerolineae bacterium]